VSVVPPSTANEKIAKNSAWRTARNDGNAKGESRKRKKGGGTHPTRKRRRTLARYAQPKRKNAEKRGRVFTKWLLRINRREGKKRDS